MTSAVIVLAITGVAVGIVAAAGAGLFALILVPIGIGVAIWLAVTGGTGRTATDVAHEASNPDLLGPGGADDPDR